MRTRRRVRSSQERVLVAATAGWRLDPRLVEEVSALASGEVDELLLAASRHGVTGLLGQALMAEPELGTGVLRRVQHARSRVVRDHLRAVGELALVADRLDAAQVTWLLCKGPALAGVAYPQPHLREYTDLDVLVSEPDLEKALRALGDAGCVIDGPELPALRRIGAGEIRLRSPAGVPVDLHWDLVNDPAVRTAFDVDPPEVLLGRARPLELHGTRLQTLDPVDTLLHVALHACSSGGWRLLWLRDLVQAARAAQHRHEQVVARSRRWGVELVLDSMLDRTERVLRTPARLAAAGTRRPWLRLLAAVDAAHPPVRATGRPSVTRIVTNSTRRNSASSACELLRRSAAFAHDTTGVGWLTADRLGRQGGGRPQESPAPRAAAEAPRQRRR